MAEKRTFRHIFHSSEIGGQADRITAGSIGARFLSLYRYARHTSNVAHAAFTAAKDAMEQADKSLVAAGEAHGRLDGVEQRFDAHRTIIDHVDESVAVLGKAVGEDYGIIGDIIARVEALQTGVSAVNTFLDKVLRGVGTLEGNLKAVEAKTETANRVANEAEASAEAANERIHAFADDPKVGLNVRVGSVETQLATFTDDVQSAKDSATGASELVTQFQGKLSRVERELKELQAAVKDVKPAESASPEKVAALESSLETLQQSVTGLTTRLDALHKKGEDGTITGELGDLIKDTREDLATKFTDLNKLLFDSVKQKADTAVDEKLKALGLDKDTIAMLANITDPKDGRLVDHETRIAKLEAIIEWFAKFGPDSNDKERSILIGGVLHVIRGEINTLTEMLLGPVEKPEAGLSDRVTQLETEVGNADQGTGLWGVYVGMNTRFVSRIAGIIRERRNERKTASTKESQLDARERAVLAREEAVARQVQVLAQLAPHVEVLVRMAERARTRQPNPAAHAVTAPAGSQPTAEPTPDRASTVPGSLAPSPDAEPIPVITRAGAVPALGAVVPRPQGEEITRGRAAAPDLRPANGGRSNGPAPVAKVALGVAAVQVGAAAESVVQGAHIEPPVRSKGNSPDPISDRGKTQVASHPPAPKAAEPAPQDDIINATVNQLKGLDGPEKVVEVLVDITTNGSSLQVRHTRELAPVILDWLIGEHAVPDSYEDTIPPQAAAALKAICNHPDVADLIASRIFLEVRGVVPGEPADTEHFIYDQYRKIGGAKLLGEVYGSIAPKLNQTRVADLNAIFTKLRDHPKKTEADLRMRKIRDFTPGSVIKA